MSELTPKAEKTRRLIFETALDLFTKQGFEATTMREIAQTADVSLGLAYRYFDSKEAILLVLYEQMSAETAAAIAALPAGTIAARFTATMRARLEQAEPYRDAFGALFGAIMTPRSGAALLGAQTGESRQRAEDSFVALVSGSSDSPKPELARDVGKLLYAVHFAVILFWLHDRSGGQRATNALINYIGDVLPMLRVSLNLPPIAQNLSRLVRIIEGVFGA